MIEFISSNWFGLMCHERCSDEQHLDCRQPIVIFCCPFRGRLPQQLGAIVRV